MVYFACFDVCDHGVPNMAQPKTRRSDARENDVDYAVYVRVYLLLLPIGFGVVLGGEQYFLNCAAVGGD